MTISANKLYDTVNVESFLALNVIPGLYNNRIPPYDSVSNKVEVFVTYKIEMNEVQGTMTTAGYLTVTWIDIRLMWDPTNHGGLQYIYLPQSVVWKPDLVLGNGIQNTDVLGSQMGLAIVNFLGVVRWEPFEVFTTQCKIDMTYYPYDKQTCEILFTVWSYYDSDVIVTTNFTGSNSQFNFF